MLSICYVTSKIFEKNKYRFDRKRKLTIYTGLVSMEIVFWPLKPQKKSCTRYCLAQD